MLCSTDLVAIFFCCQLQFQVLVDLQLFFKFHLHLGQLVGKHAATILLLLKSSGGKKLTWGTRDRQKGVKMRLPTISNCLHFLYLSFLSDASLLMPLSFSWMMASSRGSAEPGLPVKTIQAADSTEANLLSNICITLTANRTFKFQTYLALMYLGSLKQGSLWLLVLSSSSAPTDKGRRYEHEMGASTLIKQLD